MDYSFDYATAIDNSAAAGGILGALLGFLAIFLVIALAIAVFMIIAQWKIFTKGGKPGWAAIIPIYREYVLFEMVGLKGWYVFLGLIPFVGSIILLVFSIMANINLAKCFGKDGGYAVGLILLPVIFYPILAFGKAQYTKPATANTESK